MEEAWSTADHIQKVHYANLVENNMLIIAICASCNYNNLQKGRVVLAKNLGILVIEANVCWKYCQKLFRTIQIM